MISTITNNTDLQLEANGTGKVAFENVYFKYPSSTHDILKNINLEFKKGQVIALVGENGSGKTTLLKILLGEHEVTKGVRHVHRYHIFYI